MDKPRIDTQAVYTAVASMMPSEGRDFSIDSAYGSDGKPTLVVTPLTPVGKAWIPFLVEDLSKTLAKAGVTVSAEGVQANAETPATVTIMSEMARVAREGTEEVERRFKAAVAKSAELRKAADKAREDRIAKNGKESKQDEAEIQANRLAMEAARAENRLRRIREKLPAIRDEIVTSAQKMAADDEKRGRNWGVDMNAPLTSLFDRQDVALKLKAAEDYAHQLADNRVTGEDILAYAAMAAKQYCIQKGN